MADTLSDGQIDELKEVFDLFDRNKNGTINLKDLTGILRSIGQNPSEEEIRNLVSQMDTDGTGSIDFPEFLAFIAKRQKDSLDNVDELLDSLSVFDKDDTGHLTRDTMEYAIRNLGDGLNQQEVEEFVASIPFDEEGRISYDNFIKLVLNKQQ